MLISRSHFPHFALLPLLLPLAISLANTFLLWQQLSAQTLAKLLTKAPLECNPHGNNILEQKELSVLSMPVRDVNSWHTHLAAEQDDAHT